MPTLERVPKNATPVAECIRGWDDVHLRFFILKRWRRSHDRVVDGSTYWVPVAAVDTGEIVWRGDRHDVEESARLAAIEACSSVRR